MILFLFPYIWSPPTTMHLQPPSFLKQSAWTSTPFTIGPSWISEQRTTSSKLPLLPPIFNQCPNPSLPTSPMVNVSNQHKHAPSTFQFQHCQLMPKTPTSSLALHHTPYCQLCWCAMLNVTSNLTRSDASSNIVAAPSTVAINVPVPAYGWSATRIHCPPPTAFPPQLQLLHMLMPIKNGT